MNVVLRVLGLVLVCAALAAFYRVLVSVDRREFFAAAFGTVVGWLVLQSGVEFLRPDSAE